MAQQIITTTIDDLDGTEGASTVAFSVDGGNYEIDLAPDNMIIFHEMVSVWARRARDVTAQNRAKATAHRLVGSPRRTQASRRWTKRVRDWAGAHGYDLQSGGRIPHAVILQYEHDTGDRRPQ